MAGSWHPVAEGESRREFQFPLKHGDLPESEIPDAALFLGDRGIRTRYGKAAIASPRTRMIVPAPNVTIPRGAGACGARRLPAPFRKCAAMAGLKMSSSSMASSSNLH